MMRTLGLSLLIMVSLFCWPLSVAQAATITVDFESYGVPANSYLNNLGQASPSTDFFVVDGTRFANFWRDDWQYWEGWAISGVSTLIHEEEDESTLGNLLGPENQYASATASGSGGSATYAIAFTNGFEIGDAYFNLAPGTTPVSVDITNSAWAHSSMLYGDSFGSVPFSAADNDFFLLQITGHAGADKTGVTIGTVDVLLSQTQLDQLLILTDWQTFDLTSLAGSQSLSFHLTSSDNGEWGMNTPAYFALDNFVFSTLDNNASNAAPEPATSLMLLGGAIFLVRRRAFRRPSGIEAAGV